MVKLSIIIPVYNEKETIKEIIKQVSEVKIPKEIILIDDHSTDGTREILETEYAHLRNITVLLHKKNRGKGAAIRTGLNAIGGDIVIIQDADLEYDPKDYPKLIKPILEGKTQVVYGSRFLNKKNKHQYGLNMFATRLLTFMANILYNARITDEPTCYKVFTKQAIKSVDLKCEKFEFCPEVTAKIRKNGYKIIEVPIEYNSRSIEEGKKINWKDGVQAIWTLIKYRIIK
ncbi:glycosyltransferase family 2 protein [Candidatus Woesearchaeota archaeon]|jgi:glycosyltransferase involved in cell wall biosynthesis|nr:glycosyltransferase family 2 protein [Candidatus Woesearchaeota archaeon]MBT7557532.1 glycosyltransferase family 2 protein [Candidatus Woesearchaeota archaeon]MBT7786648.1 glycosyltransferase family 2 protein [Candidatus Woesearchaeota archaeon]